MAQECPVLELPLTCPAEVPQAGEGSRSHSSHPFHLLPKGSCASKVIRLFCKECTPNLNETLEWALLSFPSVLEGYSEKNRFSKGTNPQKLKFTKLKLYCEALGHDLIKEK